MIETHISAQPERWRQNADSNHFSLCCIFIPNSVTPQLLTKEINVLLCSERLWRWVPSFNLRMNLIWTASFLVMTHLHSLEEHSHRRAAYRDKMWLQPDLKTLRHEVPSPMIQHCILLLTMLLCHSLRLHWSSYLQPPITLGRTTLLCAENYVRELILKAGICSNGLSMARII